MHIGERIVGSAVIIFLGLFPLDCIASAQSAPVTSELTADLERGHAGSRVRDFSRTRRAILFALAVLAVLLCADGFAASPPGFTRKLWQTQDGLPEQTVQAFAQTADHYLWIGTTGGLVRFDGARFTIFDRENTPELKENSVFALMASRDGSLWIGTEGGGLARYKSGQFRAYGSGEGLSDGFVRALHEDQRWDDLGGDRQWPAEVCERTI